MQRMPLFELPDFYNVRANGERVVFGYCKHPIIERKEELGMRKWRLEQQGKRRTPEYEALVQEYDNYDVDALWNAEIERNKTEEWWTARSAENRKKWAEWNKYGGYMAIKKTGEGTIEVPYLSCGEGNSLLNGWVTVNYKNLIPPKIEDLPPLTPENKKNFTLNGTCKPNYELKVIFSGSELEKNLTCDDAGNWTTTLTPDELENLPL